MSDQGEALAELNGLIDVLIDLFILRGAPAFIRSDSGPEFIAQAVRDWVAACPRTDRLY